LRARVLTVRCRAIGLLGTFGDDDFVGPEGRPGGATFGRTILCTHVAATAIDDEVKAGVAPERDRQEIEQLVIPSRDDDPVVRHVIAGLSAER
jgi:hypothetical protein